MSYVNTNIHMVHLCGPALFRSSMEYLSLLKEVQKKLYKTAKQNMPSKMRPVNALVDVPHVNESVNNHCFMHVSSALSLTHSLSLSLSLFYAPSLSPSHLQSQYPLSIFHHSFIVKCVLHLLNLYFGKFYLHKHELVILNSDEYRKIICVQKKTNFALMCMLV